MLHCPAERRKSDEAYEEALEQDWDEHVNSTPHTD